jgi:hypothetical protein
MISYTLGRVTVSFLKANWFHPRQSTEQYVVTFWSSPRAPVGQQSSFLQLPKGTDTLLPSWAPAFFTDDPAMPEIIQGPETETFLIISLYYWTIHL